MNNLTVENMQECVHSIGNNYCSILSHELMRYNVTIYDKNGKLIRGLRDRLDEIETYIRELYYGQNYPMEYS